jgi:hypothetical protein
LGLHGHFRDLVRQDAKGEASGGLKEDEEFSSMRARELLVEGTSGIQENNTICQGSVIKPDSTYRDLGQDGYREPVLLGHITVSAACRGDAGRTAAAEEHRLLS